MNSIEKIANIFAQAHGFDLSSKSREGDYIEFKKHLTRILNDYERLSDTETGLIINRGRVNTLQAVKKHKIFCETEKGFFEKYKEYLSKWNQLKAYTIENAKIIKLLKDDWNAPEFEAVQNKLNYKDFKVLAEFINNVILPEYEQH